MVYQEVDGQLVLNERTHNYLEMMNTEIREAKEKARVAAIEA